jgi:hypothetical protein
MLILCRVAPTHRLHYPSTLSREEGYIYNNTFLSQYTQVVQRTAGGGELQQAITPHKCNCLTSPHKCNCLTSPHKCDCPTSPHKCNCLTPPHKCNCPTSPHKCDCPTTAATNRSERMERRSSERARQGRALAPGTTHTYGNCEAHVEPMETRTGKYTWTRWKRELASTRGTAGEGAKSVTGSSGPARTR